MGPAQPIDPARSILLKLPRVALTACWILLAHHFDGDVTGGSSRAGLRGGLQEGGIHPERAAPFPAPISCPYSFPLFSAPFPVRILCPIPSLHSLPLFSPSIPSLYSLPHFLPLFSSYISCPYPLSLFPPYISCPYYLPIFPVPIPSLYSLPHSPGGSCPSPGLPPEGGTMECDSPAQGRGLGVFAGNGLS